MENENRESIAKEVGNGAHVYVPREWLGDIVRVTRVAGMTPPLFEGLETGDSVSIEYVSDETDETQTVDGTVKSVESSVTEKSFNATLQLEWEENDEEMEAHDRDNVEVKEAYTVTVTREPGEDGWEGPYELRKKTMTEAPFGDEDDDVGMWEVIGNGTNVRLGDATSLSVKRTVDA